MLRGNKNFLKFFGPMTILTVFGAANQQKWLKPKHSVGNLFKVPNVIENEGSHQDLKIALFFTSYLPPLFHQALS